MKTSFAAANPEGRDLIPNDMQPNPRYSIKREKIENKRVNHTWNMNNRDKYQSSLREEPPYKMYKTIQDDMIP